ncbi:hypothetical protein [Streptacidiphilus carbonis]|jgi:hypothetical protein|uniref:hypothetical protein n=1 Tax=Streptacidiphilus carbonis TaxID=105422 RepID=UPI0005AA8346|nr:hypothetical protein [Streptacidiphilus carbonis]
MSINRAVLALGAVAVVGVGTVGFSVQHAHSKGKPVPSVSVVSGSTWKQIAPPADSCYNGGDALTTAQQKTCAAAITAQLTKGDIPTLQVNNANVTFGIDVGKDVAGKQWFARSSSSAPVSPTKKQYAGPLTVSSLMVADSTTGTTPTTAPVLVVAGTGATNAPVYGEWLFEIAVKS